MATPKFSKLELQIMQALWDRGAISIREIQKAFPGQDLPSYTTVQTTHTSSSPVSSRLRTSRKLRIPSKTGKGG